MHLTGLITLLKTLTIDTTGMSLSLTLKKDQEDGIAREDGKLVKTYLHTGKTHLKKDQHKRGTYAKR